MVVGGDRARSRVESFAQEADRRAVEQALAYMGLDPGTPIEEIAVDRVFIGSCTNSRIEDLRAAARVAKGQHVNPKVRAMVVPGSQAIKHAAEQEGLHRIFLDAGFEWRESGCSMCLGMNPDILQPGERCASTSNRNFEGRQGRGGRTHLVSPDGGRGRNYRTFHRHKELAVSIDRTLGVPRLALRECGPPARIHHATISQTHRRRCPARQSKRGHRSDHPQAVLEAHRAHGLRRIPVYDWRFSGEGNERPKEFRKEFRKKTGDFVLTSRAMPRPRSWLRAKISAAAPLASTPSGRWRIMVSGW
jgi:hypothetical protein